MHLETAIFYNRAPIENLRIDFKDNGVNVLTAINGKGKTTILSHIADAFYELARKQFSGSFKENPNAYYRISSSNYVINAEKSSIVYFRFRDGESKYDYVDYRNFPDSSEEYDSEIAIDNKIPFETLKQENGGAAVSKYWEPSVNLKIKDIFWNNILTYFPSYRFEYPAYLNSSYKPKNHFNTNLKFSDTLPNPIENVTSLENISNWIMDVVLDKEVNKTISDMPTTDNKVVSIDTTPEVRIWKNINLILQQVLSSKGYSGVLRFGIGRRNNGGQRIGIMNETPTTSIMVCPNISQLSSGELALLTLFNEIIRQGDTLKSNVAIEDITGIVLIDEIEENLHIRLQKEILPNLFKLFPKVQFIVCSHSPFFNMGLADLLASRSQILDLDNGGVSIVPENNDQYRQVYEMMLGENKKYLSLYESLKSEVVKDTKPLIVTEGKTDVKHIRNAMKKLNINLDVDFYDVESQNWSDSELWKMLDGLSKIKQQRKVIGIFDRDTDNKNWKDLLSEKYKPLGVEKSNVFAFCIPLVHEDIYGLKISIEHYYVKKDLMKKDDHGRRLFLGSEFYNTGNSVDGLFQTKTGNIKNKVEVNGIIDEKVFVASDLKNETSVALPKNDFAELVENDDFSKDFDYTQFNEIFNIIKEIIELP